jgi:hypothetical protein
MIKLPRRTVFFAALAMAWLGLAVIFAGIFIIEEHNHDCIGEKCLICLEIQIAQRLIESFGRLCAGVVLISFVVYTASSIRLRAFLYSKKPIELKVRLNC